MADTKFVLYTYKVAQGETSLAFYEGTDKDALQAHGQKLNAAFEADPEDSFAEFTFNVYPLLPDPTK